MNGGQRKVIADAATVGSQSYQIRSVDVNEAPDALRILSQTLDPSTGQPTSQVALDWANPTQVYQYRRRHGCRQ